MRPMKNLFLIFSIPALLLMCSSGSWGQRPTNKDSEQIRIQLALVAALQKHRSEQPKLPATGEVQRQALPKTIKTSDGRTLYLCNDGSCYCPTPDCDCIGGKCVGSVEVGTACKCGSNCTCASGECGDPNCPSLRATLPIEGVADWLLYRLAYNSAMKNNKPLLIWIGETCPEYERQWGEFVHARLTLAEYNSNNNAYGQVSEPCVKICKPDGLGGMSVVGTRSGIPTRVDMDSVAGIASSAPTQARSAATPTTIRVLPAATFQPLQVTAAPAFRPMAMSMGGFGGGMPMGGFGGGMGGGMMMGGGGGGSC